MSLELASPSILGTDDCSKNENASNITAKCLYEVL